MVLTLTCCALKEDEGISFKKTVWKKIIDSISDWNFKIYNKTHLQKWPCLIYRTKYTCGLIKSKITFFEIKLSSNANKLVSPIRPDIYFKHLEKLRFLKKKSTRLKTLSVSRRRERSYMIYNTY